MPWEKVMRTASRAILTSCLVLAVSSASTTPASSEAASRAQQIEELLSLTGAGDIGVQVMNGMLEPMKQALPQVPAEWWQRFAEKVDPGDLNKLAVPIYERYFSDEEIGAMLDFYRTPEGQSILSKLPVVMQESMAAGQAWGQELAEDVLRELEEDGYELPQRFQS